MRALFTILLLGAAAFGTARADANSDAETALKHLYLAAQAGEITQVHANLHRAVNCLVGPKDSLFDAAVPNPCAKSGTGLIAATKNPMKKAHLQEAVDMAEMAIASRDFEKAIMLATGAAGAVRASQSIRR